MWSPCSYGRTTGLYIEPLGETYHSHGSSTHLPVVDGFALWSERVYNPPLSHSFVASINVIIFHHNNRTARSNEGLENSRLNLLDSPSMVTFENPIWHW